jgi:hypothetical protein
VVFALLTILAFLPSPALALIAVEFPVSRIYGDSQSVRTGKVLSVRADNSVVAVKVASVAKGDDRADQFLVQILKPAEVLAKVAPGSPAVLFVGKAKGDAVGILHLADAWLLAKRLPGGNEAWRVEQRYDAIKAFPGRTAALAAIVEEIAAGKCSLIDKMEPEVFRRAPRLMGKLPVAGATFLAAADLNADGKCDLLVGAADGVRLFLPHGDDYRDVTADWGLAAAKTGYPAFGDLNADGKCDLLLGSQVYLNVGGKFSPAATLTLPGGTPLAAAVLDATGDGKGDAVFLSAEGELRIAEGPLAAGKPARIRPPVRLWRDGNSPVLAAAFGNFGDTAVPCVLAVRENGITRCAVDGNAPPADFQRLTGLNLQAHYQRYRGGLKSPRAAAIDINGDGRGDLFVLTATGGLLLVNRGFGAFLVDYDAGGVLAPKRQAALPFKLTPATPWAVADLNADGLGDLLILTEDGQLYEVRNIPAPVMVHRPLVGRCSAVFAAGEGREGDRLIGS